MDKFCLVILEYTNSENVITVEQKWIDYFKPEYNTNPTAASSKGYKHTTESIDKIREAVLGRKHTSEVKILWVKIVKKRKTLFMEKHTR